MTTCKCCYKLRWFHSRGAFLILLWIFVGGVASFSLFSFGQYYQHKFKYPKWLNSFPVLPGLVGGLVSGWLADAKLGNYRVCKYGLWILFASTLLASMITLIPVDSSQDQSPVWISCVICVGGSLFFIGAASFFVTSLQLGLDQMPDASSTGITSFISWLVLILNASYWCAYNLNYSLSKCLAESPNFATIMQLCSLVPPSSMAIILVLDYTLAPKWLIIEPKSPQSLRTIYRVLKFAAKHKAPLNRSALTYWEEDVPSRMDLGKSRYGGPFTTEQVEDVKTILRLFVFGLSLLVSCFSIGLGHQTILISPSLKLSNFAHISNMTHCNEALNEFFTYNPSLWSMIWILFCEFIVYPLSRSKLAHITIMKRIGIIISLATVFSIVFLIIELVYSYTGLQVNVLPLALLILRKVSKGILQALLICSVLEFVCAQTPYKMRGFFVGYTVFLVLASLSLGSIVTSAKFIDSEQSVFSGVNVGVSVFGFILYCVLAHWYKRRVRDEDYHPQPVVEEIYDRYLSN